ncbi:pyridoxal phosphate-dependent transferase [Lentinula detonsa]|uniref:Pyridoxal phosphate-dependent transferase n=1 Tax=Lentinula detonsa TaxID=2804962 RepID=A0A9W8NZ30_9AGAR|nr:pyridoxal phosphate-dependent transferase [Lentinula detonsa]
MPLSFKLSKSILSTISPPIPTAYKWIPKLKLTRPASLDILDMSQGVPGTVPHPLLQQSLRETSQRVDAWGYCPAEGEWQLREALALEMRDSYGHGAKTVDISPNDIAITSGCNLAFVATIMAIADAGDEVILPVPWYFNHQMTLTLLGITPIPLITSPESSFLPSAALASSLITSKTRAIALVTPNNPTGAVYPPSLIAQFAKLASEKGIALILDETYRDFIVGDADVIERPHGLFDSDSESEDKLLTTISNKKLPWHSTLISLYSFSKSYRIPGHRLGAITASPELLREICKVLDTLQICAPRPVSSVDTNSKKSVLSTLKFDILSTALAIHARQRLFKDTLEKEAPRWRVVSQGAYYAFVQHPFPDHGSEEICRKLVEEVGVRVLPGSFFFDKEVAVTSEAPSMRELDRYIRFSVANVSDEKVVQVCRRLGEAERMFREEFGWLVEGEV